MSTTKRINSRAKGVQGELGARDLLREYGYEAHRGQQHSGGAGSPDVIHNIPGMHIEVKWVNGGNLYRWLGQAIQDAGDQIPAVFHRMDRREWVVIMRAKDFLHTYAPPPPPKNLDECMRCPSYNGGPYCCKTEWKA